MERVLECPVCGSLEQYELLAGTGIQGVIEGCPACGAVFALQYGTFTVQRFEYRAFPVSFNSSEPFKVLDPPRTLE